MINQTAIILVNLGTPDEPTAESIRSYLKEFLSDKRVVNLPRWFWLPLLNQIILRTRPPKLVEKYALVWGKHDGPIRNITRALKHRLQSLLPNFRIVTAMTYGNPSLGNALDELEGYRRVIVIPLFPQYAGATTGAVRDALARALATRETPKELIFLDDYFTEPDYIDALAASISNAHAFRTSKPKVVFSFHGIPKSQSDAGDPYSFQCETTAALVAARLDLPQERWMLTYQSRFGPMPWLKPYTDKVMAALPGEGVDDVLVVCPGFSVDCLETIEEIKIQNRDIFLEAGGKHFNYVKALNASWRHVNLMQTIIQKKIVSQS